MPNATLPLPTRSGPSARARPPRRRWRGIVLLLVVAVGGAGAWAWWNGSVGSVTVREHCTAVANGTTTELDPEQAGNAAIIAGIANKRGLPARAASIGIATAIQESKLRNITYGDRDSLGLFQQRPSQGWGTKQQVKDPVYATNAFFDVLAKVDGFQNMAITEVAQKVQRSAFPSAYADHEPEARIIASALSGYSPAGFTCTLHQPSTTAQAPGTDGLTQRRSPSARPLARRPGRSRPRLPAAAEPSCGTRSPPHLGTGPAGAWLSGRWPARRPWTSSGSRWVTGSGFGRRPRTAGPRPVVPCRPARYSSPSADSRAQRSPIAT